MAGALIRLAYACIGLPAYNTTNLPPHLCCTSSRCSVIGSALSSMRRRNGNRACPGFTWKEDGTAVVCSKRGAYEAELAEFNRKHAPWRQLQAVLDGEGAPPSGGGDGPGAVQQQQQPQQQQDSGDASNPADGGPPAKKQRL